jgi:hypothetical protein
MRGTLARIRASTWCLGLDFISYVGDACDRLRAGCLQPNSVGHESLKQTVGWRARLRAILEMFSGAMSDVAERKWGFSVSCQFLVLGSQFGC